MDLEHESPAGSNNQNEINIPVPNEEVESEYTQQEKRKPSGFEMNIQENNHYHGFRSSYS